MQIAMRLRPTRETARRLAVFCLAGGLLCAAAEAAVAAPDSALYWSLSRDGQPVGFLLGTIHSEDPRVVEFSEALVNDLDSAEVFAMEMVPDLPTLTRLTEFMHYQDGTTLAERIGQERFERVQTALANYSVPPDWIARMKVWAVMMTLSVPPPQTGFFMDFSLSLRAAGAGLKVVGLETLEQQLSFLEDMPEEQQLALLDQALDEYGQVNEIHETMVESYLANDLQALSAQVEDQMGALTPDARDYFLKEGIEQRNRRMLASLLSYLGSQRVFVAVGALHLPGPAGLLELLRGQGIQLTPLPLPFSATEPGGEAEQQPQHETTDAP
jgi:uncharacterized protein YbaP (TraB family)